MIRVYKQIRRRLSLSKHEKLLEESGQDPIVEGVTFYVRYLGSCLVVKPSGEEATAEAIKSIVHTAKRVDRKLNRVALIVSIKGIKMSDLETGKTTFDFSIYRISYCSADSTYTHVFAFIAVNRDESLECHAFLGRKQKIAQSATLTIAQAFNLAFDRWKESQEKTKQDNKNSNKCEVCKCGCKLQSDSENTIKNSIGTQREESSVNQAFVENNQCSSKDSDTSLRSGYKRSSIINKDNEMLLIDLRSPGDSLDEENISWTIETSEPLNAKLAPNFADQTEMDLTFSRLHENKTPLQILEKLPPNSSSLTVSSFSCSPLDTPLPSPLHGSCLTPGQLMTPVCSPLPRHREVQRTCQIPPSPLARSVIRTDQIDPSAAGQK